MSRLFRGAAIAAVAASAAACAGSGGSALETFSDSASYALGMNIGSSIQREQAELSVPQLLQGLEDVLQDEPTAFSVMEAQQLVRRLAQQAREAMSVRAQQNLQEGEAFLRENAERDGVTTTASGLQYEVLEEGDGPRPGPTDTVRVQYSGTLIDGTQFDASNPDSSGVTFALNRVIPGWSEAVQLMPVGSTYKFYIPAQLAYGERGQPPHVPPNAALIFEVELLGIE